MSRNATSSVSPPSAKPSNFSSFSIGVALFTCTAALLLAGCQKQEAAEKKLPIMVRTETVAMADYAPRTALTGVIAARTLNNLSFRVGGRVAERLADVGQHVDKGAVLARIDPQEQESDLRSAQADLDAAQAQLTQSAAAFERQKTLLAQGYTTRRDYDAADQALKVAQGSLDAAQSALANAKQNLSFTELKAGAAGVITARQVETGQVVQAAQTVFTVAEDGDRDAVFNVQETLVARTPTSPAVTITLLSDPQIRATGKVREISPAVDPASGSIRVKVGIADTPAGMPLGAAVIGSVGAKPAKAILLPWQALTSSAGKPAVWIVDPSTGTVTMAPVEVLAFNSGTVVIARGLEEGQSVVTAGGQLLSAGQKIEISGAGQ
ncbi:MULTISPECIES: efflux RND transporter periplasmic adaptor subunit [unclassified Mesorhizobium]|uniref:efflux RND transporter periplasmic adaptor subunit n=1 Tax=unclassified Mesorhizobium TaxID=325217 RepID=UPI00112CF646|nr:MULTISPECIES: efflux RND transporter periplasmic adaptor subunit [unclassified Mesorhizobium]MBZ9982270.1 efflux RND transporter periplasmic adaptor subunit [Mesorhizobium sp. BR-1-1-8]TPL34810.1 efflux RND transporter periplasmic adaptor subunit [Mesorhizobium sp. B2-4-8]TPL64632.1 efflux RND transporter periplasmic adaptor subunit [Mesorhizobium sp. B2-4-1]TPN11174.1 efflux RND transporter periplasmic adaptor subunit [Mesorhizobium sp. B2-1-3]